MTFILRLLEHLDLPDDYMSQRVDTLLNDFIGEHITNQILYKGCQGRLLGTLLQNVSGSLANGFHLTITSIRCFGELFLLFLSKSIDKHSHNKAILCLDINKDIDERMPLANELTQFVPSHI